MKSPDRGATISRQQGVAGATSRMKRNTLYLLGILAFISWLLITYFLFLQKPNTHNSKLAAEQAEKNRVLNAKVEELDLQLKEQLKSNSLLLSKLVKIRGEGRDEVRIHAVLDLLEDPGLDVAEVLRREKKLLEDLKAKEKKSEQSQSRHLPVQPIESKHNEPKGGDSNRQPVITRVRPRVEQSKDLDEEPKEEEEEGEEGRDDEEKDEEEGVEDNTGVRKPLDDGDEDIGVEDNTGVRKPLDDG